MAKVVIGGSADYGSWGQSSIVNGVLYSMGHFLSSPLIGAGEFYNALMNQTSISATKITSNYPGYFEGENTATSLTGLRLNTPDAEFKSLSSVITDTNDPGWKLTRTATLSALGQEPGFLDITKYAWNGVYTGGKFSGSWTGDSTSQSNGSWETNGFSFTDNGSWSEGASYSGKYAFSMKSTEGIYAYGSGFPGDSYPTGLIGAYGSVNSINYLYQSKSGTVTSTESYVTTEANPYLVDSFMFYHETAGISPEAELLAREKIEAALFFGKDDISGSSYDDDIRGYGGNDVIKGNAGVDDIWGGTGKDIMSGGVGADAFYFSWGDSSLVRSLQDVIQDFKANEDDIVFEGLSTLTFSTATLSISYLQARAKAQAEMLNGSNVVFASDNKNGYLFVDYTGDSIMDEAITLTGVRALSQSSLWLLDSGIV